MVGFAGYDMPLQYPSGIIAEHNHTRQATGLFDASHMGQIRVTPRSGTVADAAAALEALVPGDIPSLAVGRQRYTQFTTADGGILDDLMVARLDGALLLVVNASRKHDDLALLRSRLEPDFAVELLDRGLLALQGPKAADCLASLAPAVAGMRFMDVGEIVLAYVPCFVSRSGYTGEDGFEIGVPSAQMETVARLMLADPAVRLAGLAARDSLRLEAGLCLCGADLDSETSPIEAGLGWSIRRAGESFPGADRIRREQAEGPARRRVGLRVEGRIPLRAGAELFSEAGPAGRVTSGGFAPTINAPVAMAYVAAEQAAPGTPLFAEIRGNRVAATVTKLPFVPSHYRR